MHVQAAEPGQVEHPSGEDLPVRDDDEDVRARVGETRDGGVILQRRRLENMHSQGLRERCNRRVGHLGLPPDGLSRLRNDEGDVVSRARSASSVGTANEGEPKKTMRTPTVYRHETPFSL